MGHANFYVLITDWLNEMNWQTMERRKEQDMGIEALEAMLMDDEFRGAPFLSFRFFQSKQTNDMQWQKFILSRVALILLIIASRYQYLHRLGWLAVHHGAVFFLFPEFGHVLMVCSFSCVVLDS